MAATVTLTVRGAQRVRSGHPWVFQADVAQAQGQDDVARVLDARGAHLGTALWAEGAQLPLRMISRGEVRLDEEFLCTRISAAMARRAKLTGDAFRLVHGEADQLPGLVIDRYADVVVIQTSARAMDSREKQIAQLVTELCGARLVVSRDDGSARDFEGLPRKKEILTGSGATRVGYHDAGSAVEVDVMEDGKTGGFLDQVANHARAGEYARGDTLDAFTYHGGFALALARGGARSVLALDESAPSVARARENVLRNGAEVEVTQANAFDALRALESEGRRFDVVVLDPPALAKRKSAFGAPDRAYKELNLRGLRLCKPDGILVTCSCSGKMPAAQFGEIIESAARDAGRTVQILERRGAGPDHPVLLGVPETDYLKCWILRVLP